MHDSRIDLTKPCNRVAISKPANHAAQSKTGVIRDFRMTPVSQSKKAICTRRQNSSLIPSWMFRGGVTVPFQTPKSGLAMSLLKAYVPPLSAALPEATR